MRAPGRYAGPDIVLSSETGGNDEFFPDKTGAARMRGPHFEPIALNRHDGNASSPVNFCESRRRETRLLMKRDRLLPQPALQLLLPVPVV